MAWGFGLRAAWWLASRGAFVLGANEMDNMTGGHVKRVAGEIVDDAAGGIRQVNPELDQTLRTAETLTGVTLPGADAPPPSKKPPTSTEFDSSAAPKDTPELFSQEWFTDLLKENALGGGVTASLFALGWKAGGWQTGAALAGAAVVVMALKNPIENTLGVDIDFDGHIGPAPDMP